MLKIDKISAWRRGTQAARVGKGVDIAAGCKPWSGGLAALSQSSGNGGCRRGPAVVMIL